MTDRGTRAPRSRIAALIIGLPAALAALVAGATLPAVLGDLVSSGVSGGQGAPGPEVTVALAVVLGLAGLATAIGLAWTRRWALVLGWLVGGGALLAGLASLGVAVWKGATGGYGIYAVAIFGPVGLVVLGLAGAVLALLARAAEAGEIGRPGRRDWARAGGTVALFVLLWGGLALAFDAARETAALRAADEARANAALNAAVTIEARVHDVHVATTVARGYRIRVLDRLRLELAISSEADVELQNPPYICFHSQFAGPAGDHACWNGELMRDRVAAALAGPNPGTPMLHAGRPLRLELDLARQTARCDFPSGRWTLEVTGVAKDGTPIVRQVAVEVPLDGTGGRLTGTIEEIRLCLLDAEGVHNVQGEIGD
jgi:hypothetical protein